MNRLKRALLLIAMLLVPSLSMLAQIDAERVVRIGRNALSFKDYALAIQYFNTAIQYMPELAEPYFYRGLAKFSLDDLHGTEADCDACIERNPFIYNAYFLRALARHSQGKDSLALADYQIVLQDNPDDQGALHNTALLYIAAKDSISARQTIDRLQRFYSNYAPSYVIDGGLALQQGDTLRAQTLFNKGIEVSPTSPASYLSLANIAYSQQRYKEALDLINKALVHDGENTDIYTNRALVYFQLNNLRGAMTDYTTAINLKHNNLLALYNRALLRNRVGEYTEAMQDFDRVLGYDPNNAFARFNRALIGNELGMYAKAKGDFDKIIERYPTFVPAYLERARAKKYLGDTRGAEIDLYRASQLNDPKVAARIRQQQDRDNNAEEDNPETKDTRTEKDENIRKFRMLIYDESARQAYNQMYREEEGIRGRLQDRHTTIDIEPLFIFSYYEDTHKSPRQGQNYNTLFGVHHTRYTLKAICHIPTLSENLIADHRQALAQPLSAEANSLKRFDRAMDLLTLRDYQAAAELFISLSLEGDTPLAHLSLFQYTTTQLYFIESEIRSQGEDATASTNDGINRQLLRLRAQSEEVLEKLEELAKRYSTAAPVLYNLGTLCYKRQEYQRAIDYFSQALQIDPMLSAAFFNRGLCYYAIGEKLLADKDMSQAGSLGIYRAYSIIKRMQ